jgi:hypothetical protein
MKVAAPKAVDGVGNCAEQERRLAALIRELLRIRTSDPPANDEDIRRYRHEGRP